MISLVADYWPIAAWAVAVAAAYILGGWRLALAVGSIGALATTYTKGRNDANKSHKERASSIERRREEAYSEIDRRGASADDVRDRLRGGDY